MPTPLTAHYDQKKARSQAIFSAVGSVGVLIFLFNARTAETAPDQGLEAMIPVFFGLGIFVLFAGMMFKAIKTLRNPNQDAVLRIDENGVFDARVGQGVIPWAAIKEVELIDLNNSTLNREIHNKDVNRQPNWAVRLNVENAADYLNAGLAKTLSDATGHDRIILASAELNTQAQTVFEAVSAFRT